jgi:hypothetical protein
LKANNLNIKAGTHIVWWFGIKFNCRICDRTTKATNPEHKRVRIGNNTCKECIYIIGHITPGVVWV